MLTFTNLSTEADEEVYCCDSSIIFGQKLDNSESTSDQQLMKEISQKFARMEMELRETEQLCLMEDLRIEKKALQAELEQQKQMMEQFLLLHEKVEKMEKENYASDDQFTAQLHNDRKAILERISELENRQKEKFSNVKQQNCWDANACHYEIEVTDAQKLTAAIQEWEGDRRIFRSVFAKHPLPYATTTDFHNIFYFEILIIRMRWTILFGFSVKQLMPLNEKIQDYTGTYVFSNCGEFWANGSRKGETAKFSRGDVVGIGVDFGTRQIFFTKNGQRLGFTHTLDLDCSVDFDHLFPFATLLSFEDKIVANFGPNFKFDRSVLC